MSGKATISQLGPDTGVRQNVTSLAEFRAAGLSKARNLLRDHITLVMCLPLEKMWDFFPTKYKLDEVRRHLVDKGLLVDGKWKGIHRDRLEKKQTGDTEYKIFEPVSDIFNQILAFVESNQQGDTAVRRMVHAGTMTPTSTRRSGGSRPDAFLEMASPCPNTAKGKQRVYRWRDITCPFEYKFGKGDSADVRPHWQRSGSSLMPLFHVEPGQADVEPPSHHAIRCLQSFLLRCHYPWL